MEGISHPLHYHWELCGGTGSDCKEPGCDTKWPADLCSQHHWNKPFLQIYPPQDQKETSIPHPGGSTGIGPGSCHLSPRLLQLAPGQCAYMYHPTSVTHLECSGPASLHCTQVFPFYTNPPHPALATSGCSNPIQDAGTCLLCREWLRPILHLGHGQTLPLPKNSLYLLLFLNVTLEAFQHFWWSWFTSMILAICGLYPHGWMH